MNKEKSATTGPPGCSDVSKLHRADRSDSIGWGPCTTQELIRRVATACSAFLHLGSLNKVLIAIPCTDLAVWGRPNAVCIPVSQTYLCACTGVQHTQQAEQLPHSKPLATASGATGLISAPTVRATLTLVSVQKAESISRVMERPRIRQWGRLRSLLHSLKPTGLAF